MNGETAPSETNAPDSRPPPRTGTPLHPESPLYADRRSPAYYYGTAPTYGGSGRYYDGGGYGAPYYGDTEAPGSSLIGPLTLGRVLRVSAQKWPTLMVAILLGTLGGFAYFKTAPVSYKATSTILMNVRAPRYTSAQSIIDNPNTQGASDEIFNTRLYNLGTPPVIRMVGERLRADFPELKALNEEEMYLLLFNNIEFKQRRRSRIVEIAARNQNPKIAQAIANAYALTAETYSKEENSQQSEAAVALLKSSEAEIRRKLQLAETEVLSFRKEANIHGLESQLTAQSQMLQALNEQLAQARVKEIGAIELLRVLDTIRGDPTQIRLLPESVPRAALIFSAQEALQKAITERDTLLMRYTENHPEVQQSQNVVGICQKHYLEAVMQARETADANLQYIRNVLEALTQQTRASEERTLALAQQIEEAKSRLKSLELNVEVVNESYSGIRRRMEEALQASDEISATITVNQLAMEPRRPISPDPRLAFTVGPGFGLLLGFLFVLLLDRLEDRITSTADIEQHMATKVLALIPRVPRVRRDQLVVFSATRKFSRLAESFAGLRGLLDSPRYREITRVILVVSTQPEEGKTITSGNLSISYAMSGQKTLLVDFDLRRPRIGRVFGVDEDRCPSLMETLASGDPEALSSLPVPSGLDNLDLVVSTPSPHHSPANIMGADIIPKFFQWARQHYDRVIIDSPPYGLVSDAVVLGTLSDSVMIVCRPDRSRYRAVKHAIRQFVESGARLLGVVVNDVDFQGRNAFSDHDRSNRGYGSRYGRYGYGQYTKRNLRNVRGGEPAEGESSNGSDPMEESELDELDDDE